MPKKPIGDFASVGEAKAYCQSLLQRGDELLTDEEHYRVSLLMKHHPDYREHWLLCHHVSLNGQYYSFCVFGDGKHWPTSYLKCFMKKPTANSRSLEAAYRNAIRHQKEAFKASHGGIGDVDHKPPEFSELIVRFEKELGYRPSPVYDELSNTWILPGDVNEKWQQFHQKYARLRLVSHSQHKQITAERRQGHRH